jgi:hypothetical protein
MNKRKIMETYGIVAKCRATLDCTGMPSFGATVADSLEALAETLRKMPTQEATCPICQKNALYSRPDYQATALDREGE